MEEVNILIIGAGVVGFAIINITAFPVKFNTFNYEKKLTQKIALLEEIVKRKAFAG